MTMQDYSEIRALAWWCVGHLLLWTVIGGVVLLATGGHD